MLVVEKADGLVYVSSHQLPPQLPYWATFATPLIYNMASTEGIACLFNSPFPRGVRGDEPSEPPGDYPVTHKPPPSASRRECSPYPSPLPHSGNPVRHGYVQGASVPQ